MKSTFATVIAKEIRELLPATLFFLFLFHLVALTKAVTLDDFSITALSATGATVGALIVAKAILLVDALPAMKRLAGPGLSKVLWKTLWYSAATLLFRLLEELVPLLFKHEGAMAAFRALATEVNWPLFGVIGLWIACGLFLYCLAAELVSVLGARRVKEILRGERIEHG